MKYRLTLLLFVFLSTALLTTNQVTAQDKSRERSTSGCMSMGQNRNGTKVFNCVNPEDRRAGLFLGDFTSKRKCTKQCGGYFLRENNRIHPSPKPNNKWLTAFKDGEYGNNEVYTDIRLEIDKSSLNALGTKTCEEYGFTNAFFSRLLGTQNTRNITLSVVISDRAIDRKAREPLSGVAGLVHDIFTIERDTNAGVCRATALTGSSGTIARVAAVHNKTLYINTLFFSGQTSLPLGGLKRKDGKQFSGAEEVLTTLLNGSLSQYADELALLAENLELDNQTTMITNDQISVYPLKANGDDGDYNQLAYDVKIQGQSVAKFSIYQSDDISQYGSLDTQNGFGDIMGKHLLVYQSFNDAAKSMRSISDVLTDEGRGFGYIAAAATYKNNLDEFEKACENIDDALGPFNLPASAEMRLKAMMLNDYTPSNQLLEGRGLNVCLTQNERKLPENAFISHLISGGTPYSAKTCMQTANMKPADFTWGVVSNNHLELRANTSSQAIEAGQRFKELVSAIGEPQLTPEQIARNLKRGRTCALWNNRRDDPQGIRINEDCQFVYLASVSEPATQRFWVAVTANRDADAGKIPNAEYYEIGIDLSQYVTEAAVKAKGCWAEGGSHYKN